MEIHVNAAELKSVFKDIKPILKSSHDAALLGFTVESHTLYITCSAGVIYEQRIASEHPGPYSLTVLYQDLSELLPGRGVVTLDLSPLYVGIKGESISSTLAQANGLVSLYKRRCSSMHPIAPGDVKQWHRLFAETAPVAKSLKKEASVIFKPPFAVIKFPTFWLQLPNRDLDTIMSLSDLRAVAEFAPTEFGVGDGAIEFRRGPAILAVPHTPVDSCKFIAELTEDHTSPVFLTGANYLPRIQQFVRSVGPGQCRCFLHEAGVELVVTRPSVQSSMRIGDCSSLITSIQTFTEYVQMFFKLCGEENIGVTYGKKSVRLFTQTLSMLISLI